MLYRRLYLLIGLSAFCGVGCGGPTESGHHAIHGTVKVNGTNLAKGSISFFPGPGVSGRPATAVIEDGSYRFTRDNGPFAGVHQVVIGVDEEPVVALQTGSEGVSSGIKVALPPEDSRGRRPGRPKSPPRKTKWEIECTIEENEDSQKDFELSG